MQETANITKGKTHCDFSMVKITWENSTQDQTHIFPKISLLDVFVFSVCVSQGSFIFSSLFFWTWKPKQIIQKHSVTKERCRCFCVLIPVVEQNAYMRTERTSEDCWQCKNRFLGDGTKINYTEKSCIQCILYVLPEMYKTFWPYYNTCSCRC